MGVAKKAGCLMGAPQTGIVFDAEVIRVIDGDTIEVETRLVHRIRLEDCWAKETTLRQGQTELEKRQGLLAKKHLEKLLAEKDNRVRVHIRGNGGDLSAQTNMSRIVARAWRPNDSQDLSTKMVNAGHATKDKT